MKPIVLTILDGWGYSKERLGNAILSAETPNLDNIKNNYPSLLIQTSGKAVGMTWGEPGNSEVGHLTIGAGRVMFQALSKINKSIKDGSFFNNKALLGAIDHANKNKSKLHLVGLLTSGSVHAYFDHVVSLIKLANDKKASSINLHLFTDGKDSGTKESISILNKLKPQLEKYPNVKIATISGRIYGMDRNHTPGTYR